MTRASSLTRYLHDELSSPVEDHPKQIVLYLEILYCFEIAYLVLGFGFELQLEVQVFWN